jgi:hypothetical protein
MENSKIELYKIRDFSAKMGIMIDYIRANFANLMKIVLLMAVPLALLFGILMREFFGTVGMMSENPDMSDAEAIGFASSLGITYLIILVLSVIVYSLLFSTVYHYMKLKDERGEAPGLQEVYQASFARLPGLILLSLVVAVIIIVGFFLFVLPGFYFAVVLSLAVPIYIFENVGIGTAMSRAFRLISGKWWSTFGLLVVSSIMASVISYLFTLPAYGLMLGNLFTEISEDPAAMPDAYFNMFSSWYATAGLALSFAGAYLTYVIPVVALAFQYFNLTERIEGRGIKQEVENFENLS